MVRLNLLYCRPGRFRFWQSYSLTMHTHNKKERYFALFSQCPHCDTAHVLAATPEITKFKLEQVVRVSEQAAPDHKFWISEVEIKPINVN